MAKEAIVVILFQVILLALFAIFATYRGRHDEDQKQDQDEDQEERSSVTYGNLFPLYVVPAICIRGSEDQDQDYGGGAIRRMTDVHVMIFIGFGFLMTFLKRYGYSAVGFNFLLGALIVQWAMVCQGFYTLNPEYRIEIGIDSLYEADIAAATVLISMGAVLGRTSYLQLLIMGLVEIAAFTANSYIGTQILRVSDAGASIFVHTFGAYFGLAVSYVLEMRRKKNERENSLEESRYTSDLFAMIGTVFLWLFWPSFNAIELDGDEQRRAVINTYLSLASCCVTTFALSALFAEQHRKFDMVHVQNSTLAGGVAVGASANLMLEPYGAMAVGAAAALVSVLGYVKLTPYLTSRLRLRDTCGVHNLHGMPGLLAALVSALMASLASETLYHKTLYKIYPAMAAVDATPTAEYPFLAPGSARSAAAQAGYQLLGMVVTLAVAVVTGLITGLILKSPRLDHIESENHYSDAIAWKLPENPESVKQVPLKSPHYVNSAFESGESHPPRDVAPI